MIDDKFIESFEVDDWEIETETGWEEIFHSNKTIPFVVWELFTDSFSLKCADDHIVIDENFNQVFVKDLYIGQKIKTINGLEEVKLVRCLNYEENMYDLSVNSKNHTYFTSGILSHNTTVSAVYLTHYAIFNEHKTIAILANKEKTALEILSRIKMIYEGLPLWLQPGIVDGGWNKQSITLGNGSRIIATSTASSAIRGYTINSLFLDEFAFVPPQIAEEFMNSVYPTVSSGKTSKIIIVSTPNGMNHFYNIWIDAIRGKNSYFPVKINWWEVPGRDDNFKKEIIRNQGITSWNQEYNCFSTHSNINIRNKENGLIKSVTVNELWEFGNKIFDK